LFNLTLCDNCPIDLWKYHGCEYTPHVIENGEVKSFWVLFKLTVVQINPTKTILKANPFHIVKYEADRACFHEYSDRTYVIYDNRTLCSQDIDFVPSRENEAFFWLDSPKCVAHDSEKRYWEKTKCIRRELATVGRIVQIKRDDSYYFVYCYG